MTDKFMSGWGGAKGKINKLIFECDSFDEAMTVIDNAEKRSDMNYINYRGTKKPYYNPSRYYAQVKTKSDYPKWYNPNAVW